MTRKEFINKLTIKTVPKELPHRDFLPLRDGLCINRRLLRKYIPRGQIYCLSPPPGPLLSRQCERIMYAFDVPLLQCLMCPHVLSPQCKRTNRSWSFPGQLPGTAYCSDKSRDWFYPNTTILILKQFSPK